MSDAAQLHRDALVIDSLGPDGPSVWNDHLLGHLGELAARDVPSAIALDEIFKIRDEAILAGELDDFWDQWDASGVDVSSYTIGAFGADPFSYANAIRDLARWTRKFDSLDRLVKVTKADGAVRAHDEGKHGVILNFQNTTHFGDDLEAMHEFYDLGVRIMQLTYNSRNLIGDGCMERNPAGLSRFGLDAVKAMNDAGILIDVSHCSHPTAMDAAQNSREPIAITHGFAKSLSEHDRGARDELLRAIGERNGYVGVVCVPFFLSADPDVSLDHFVRHVEHIASIVGIDKVGIGTDWEPPHPATLQRMLAVEIARLGFRPEHRVDWSAVLKGFETWHEGWPAITETLLASGYSPDETRGLVGGNFLRVFRDVAG